jgi:hypothetical protein
MDEAVRRELDQVTAMLCALLHSREDIIEMPPAVQKWFAEHCEHDRLHEHLRQAPA